MPDKKLSKQEDYSNFDLQKLKESLLDKQVKKTENSEKQIRESTGRHSTLTKGHHT